VKLGRNIRQVSEHCLKGFRGSEVKGQVVRVEMCEWCNGRGVHFNGVALNGILQLIRDFGSGRGLPSFHVQCCCLYNRVGLPPNL